MSLHRIADRLVEVYEVDGEWFWGECFENGMPASSPVGPFDSQEAALRDARR
jgi:hypothetical protein